MESFEISHPGFGKVRIHNVRLQLCLINNQIGITSKKNNDTYFVKNNKERKLGSEHDRTSIEHVGHESSWIGGSGSVHDISNTSWMGRGKGVCDDTSTG